jgi:RNA ligase
VYLSQPHVILEKLDGSMVRPFFDAQGQIRWGTKMGDAVIARNAGEFAERNLGLMAFVEHALSEGITPIFEWCSRSQRIVVDYPQDRLVLTAMRNMIHGNYLTMDEMRASVPSSVDLVRTVPGAADLDAVVDQARQLAGEEGWVIRWDSGEMIKLKADEYVRQHRALDGLRWEKDVLALILAGETDDVRSIVLPEVREQLDRFEHLVNKGMIARARALESAVNASRGMDRKTFAQTVAAQWPYAQERSMLFRIFEGQQAMDLVIDMLKKHLSSQSAVDSVRWVWGDFQWNARAMGDLDA